MLSSELLAEVEKLAGIRPKRPSKVSGTRAKLALKQRPRKAAKLHGKIQGRADSSKRKIASRQKNPHRTMYKSPSARASSLKKKLSFQRRGESLGELVQQVRDILLS